MVRFICVAVLICINGISFGAEKYFANSIGMEFVLVPSGSFMMGSSTGRENEKVVHKVNITSDFYIGKYEVTQAEWHQLMGTNPSYFQGSRSAGDTGRLPVENISWNYARDFVKALNEREGTSLYRLPTEAEWEYVARAGKVGAVPLTDKFFQVAAWYRVNSNGKTNPVGKKSPNAFGVYDMLGNVCEWVEDTYGEQYKSGETSDPLNNEGGFGKVVRGGSWSSSAEELTPHYREHRPPYFRSERMGFRVVKAAE